MRRHKFKAVADDDTLPVMVPRNDKAAGTISRKLQMLSRSEPRNVHGRLAQPLMSIAATAIPAGGKQETHTGRHRE